jgi:hypothetical protein
MRDKKMNMAVKLDQGDMAVSARFQRRGDQEKDRLVTWEGTSVIKLLGGRVNNFGVADKEGGQEGNNVAHGSNGCDCGLAE